ncbi:hypothetical protein HYV12_00165 [Candidatus Dojkabacteria bacterium]|nr:hypothetical protein [Candidatus Dojkabacteria bacterium]
MENSNQRISLILLSLAFVIVGIFIIISATRGALFPNICLSNFKMYSSGEVVSEEGDNECLCVKGKVLCAKKRDGDDLNQLTISDFVRSNLQFEYDYFASGVSPDLLSKPLGVSFTSIVTTEKSIEVQLQQSQLCSETGKPAVQIGLYNFRENTLTLLNVLNSIESIYVNPCTVTLQFKINKLTISDLSDFKLAYQTEDGQSTVADVCLYNKGIYNDGDNYVSEDKCNVCRCVGGVSRCSTDRVCK